MSKVEFEAMWQLYKDNKKKTGERNTLLLVDMMEANESFYMTKEIWNEFKEIFKDYSHFQYRANKSKQKQRDESWIFWKYFHKHIKEGKGVTQAKQEIADEFNWSFDRVDKVILRKWDEAYAENQDKWVKLFKELQDKS
jgi:hypothetical protein